MWLINCETLQLEQFVSHSDIKYAILSHVWEKGKEVQHAEFHVPEAKTKGGWTKIEMVCKLALADGLYYAWVDTCCIDKTSSAELSEAINSMFTWYAAAEICYTYLADFDVLESDATIATSRWFTRGWTLQELIAPVQIRFYDKSWISIGTKATLSADLSLATSIDETVLLASEHQDVKNILSQIPIAQRMSWAARRETTRIEDTAYCLLGIFGINLPLVYGEGQQAFRRLQEEIVRNSNDLSILAWKLPKEDILKTSNHLSILTGTFPEHEMGTNPDHLYCGVFAEHPRYFRKSGGIELINDVKFNPDFAMTNKGLKLETLLYYSHQQHLHQMNINCQIGHNYRDSKSISIYLKHQGASVYVRAVPHGWNTSGLSGIAEPSNRPIFLTPSITLSAARSLNAVHRGAFRVPIINHPGFKFLEARPDNLWDPANIMFITSGLKDFVGCHRYSLLSTYRLDNRLPYASLDFFVLFGFGSGFMHKGDPWINLAPVNSPLGVLASRGHWTEIATHSKPLTEIPLKEAFFPGCGEFPKKMQEGQFVLRNGTRNGEPVYTIEFEPPSDEHPSKFDRLFRR